MVSAENDALKGVTEKAERILQVWPFRQRPRHAHSPAGRSASRHHAGSLK